MAGRKAVIARLKRGLDRELPSGWQNGWIDPWSVWAPYLLMQDLREFAFARDRTPDILVRPSIIESSGPRRGRHSFGAPVLGIDVVPAEDYRGGPATKLHEYAALGLPRFWLLDLDDQVLHAFFLVDGAYQEEARLDDDTPRATLQTGAGTVQVSLADLLADHSGDAASYDKVALPDDLMATRTFSLMPVHWDAYECYAADGPRQDYLRGDLFARPAPTWEERVTIRRLRDALSAGLPPQARPTCHSLWKAGPAAFTPDLMVVRAEHVDDYVILEAPSLVIDVANGNNTANTVVKVQEYARGGAPHYWIVDVRDRRVLCLELVDGAYRIASQLDDQTRVADLETGSGTLRLSLEELFEGAYSSSASSTARAEQLGHT